MKDCLTWPMWHTKMHFPAKCNSGRLAIQWFHIKHLLDYQYTKFQQYTFRVQKCVFLHDTRLCCPTILKKNKNYTYEGCSNMNASSFIAFFTYMLEQNNKRFYKGLYVTFKQTLDQKKNTVYLWSYSPLNEGHVSILTNSMLRTYTSDIDERTILR